MVTDRLIQHMVRLSTKEYGLGVFPAGFARDWREAVTECDITETITLWYNVPGDKSTHNVIIKKEKRQ